MTYVKPSLPSQFLMIHHFSPRCGWQPPAPVCAQTPADHMRASREPPRRGPRPRSGRSQVSGEGMVRLSGRRPLWLSKCPVIHFNMFPQISSPKKLYPISTRLSLFDIAHTSVTRSDQACMWSKVHLAHILVLKPATCWHSNFNFFFFWRKTGEFILKWQQQRCECEWLAQICYL